LTSVLTWICLAKEWRARPTGCILPHTPSHFLRETWHDKHISHGHDVAKEGWKLDPLRSRYDVNDILAL
jgi:hypothetical protein